MLSRYNPDLIRLIEIYLTVCGEISVPLPANVMSTTNTYSYVAPYPGK